MKGKITFGFLIVILTMLPAVVNADEDTNNVSNRGETGWTLLEKSSDEFSGSTLDENKWTKGIWYDVSTDLAFKDENIRVQDGKLFLDAKKENYNGKSFTSGSLESKFEIPGTESYVEIRAKALDSRANVLSAIWMQSSPLSSRLNPNPEIDIMETFNFKKITSTLHTWRQSPSLHWQHAKNNWETGLNDISDDFHTYGLERRNGKLKFYFDRQLIWEYKSNEQSFVELSRHMVLSLEGHLGTPNPAYLPNSFEIDYVRTYFNSNFERQLTDGDYQIINRESGKALEVPEFDMNNKTQLQQNDVTSKDNQLWNIKSNNNHTFTIMNKQSEKMIDLKGDSGITKNGNPILQYDRNKQINQDWYIIPTTEDYYKIVSLESGKSVAVLNASHNNEAKVIQWTYGNDNNDTNDEWRIVKVAK